MNGDRQPLVARVTHLGLPSPLVTTYDRFPTFIAHAVALGLIGVPTWIMTLYYQALEASRTR